MSYDYSQYSGDQIRYLTDKHIQLVKPGVFVTHSKWDEKANSHTTQLSTFSHNVIGDTRLIQHYGFASTPLAGATSVALGVMGSNTNNAIVGTHDDRYTPRDLKPGEVVLFDYQGQSIELRQDQTINISSMKTATINIDSKNQIIITDGQIHITGNAVIDQDVTINGSLHVKGNITSDSDVTASGISLKNHKHTSGAQGAPTSPPQ